MSSYSFSVEQFLNDTELQELAHASLPALRSLNQRYLPELDISHGVPAKAAYLDALRTSWLLDSNQDRPEHAVLVQGLGYAFGQLLGSRYGFRWAKINDSYGTALALVGGAAAQISVPVFHYVEKREHLRNGEVFEDFFVQAGPEVAGA
jgi:hypothetical protein